MTETKIDFRCVPQSGFAKGNGFRAEFVKDKTDVVDLDGLVKEAMDKGYFNWMNPPLVRESIKGFLQTMIDNTLKDGRTRKIDGYLETSLSLRGEFADARDDFDPERHKLAFSVKPLSAFRPDLKQLLPVNVNRIKQFRVTSIYPAEGPRKNRTVIIGKDFLIRGNSLTMTKDVHVTVNIYDPFKREGLSIDPEILSATENEIRCAWPEEVKAEHKHCYFIATVCQWNNNDYRSREIKACIKAAG